ncbi:hypothetical protein CBR_g51672 [Chara braunii]|uniref:Starch synthase catalytic domain-containing protein n=1 Tax=Chara braunii TaxID=69332 RepID=A0A388M8V3_CHABU|nr:hypothetical protein CBR_g51672 [Chara braunii]|eukprot:GBG91014.1 hypothetical protein CBR_g51672 [Chara braunii]
MGPSVVVRNLAGEDVIFIANDWHTALVPLYLKSRFIPKGIYMNAKVALCVHNLAYQGKFQEDHFDYRMLDLPEHFRPAFIMPDSLHQDKHEKASNEHQLLNWMKAGIEEADLLLTVSPTYANEVSTEEERGAGLRELVSRKGMVGIMNGADISEWSPMTDKYLDVRYDIETVLVVKPVVKEQLQAEAGLPVRPDVTLFGFMGRLQEQKGLDILAAAILTFLQKQQQQEKTAQFVLLGTGKPVFEKQVQELEGKFPTQVRGMIESSRRLAHLIVAGCDFMVVPSRYEPDGLVQLYAMLYGTPELVMEDAAKVVAGLERAAGIYGTTWYRSMVLTAMSQDLSWRGPARAWEQAMLTLRQEGRSGEAKPSKIVPGKRPSEDDIGTNWTFRNTQSCSSSNNHSFKNHMA